MQRRATSRMRSTVPTEVPPNFWTTNIFVNASAGDAERQGERLAFLRNLALPCRHGHFRAGRARHLPGSRARRVARARARRGRAGGVREPPRRGAVDL